MFFLGPLPLLDLIGDLLTFFFSYIAGMYSSSLSSPEVSPATTPELYMPLLHPESPLLTSWLAKILANCFTVRDFHSCPSTTDERTAKWQSVATTPAIAVNKRNQQSWVTHWSSKPSSCCLMPLIASILFARAKYWLMTCGRRTSFVTVFPCSSENLHKYGYPSWRLPAPPVIRK